MRYFGNLHTPFSPSIPDTRLSVLLTAATAQAFDYPTGTDLVRFTIGSTLGSSLGSNYGGPVFLEPNSTGAALPTTGGAVTTAGTSGGIPLMVGQEKLYQRPRGSTGFSLIAASSFSVCAEFWSRAGTT